MYAAFAGLEFEGTKLASHCHFEFNTFTKTATVTLAASVAWPYRFSLAAAVDNFFKGRLRRHQRYDIMTLAKREEAHGARKLSL